MSTDTILYKEESHVLIGCAMSVHNGIGHGFHEKPYENALVVEFESEGVACEQQKRFEIRYKNQLVREYVPDLIVFGKIIIDTKVIDTITSHERGQMLNYLKVSSMRLGYIINFKHPKLGWERIVV